MKEAAKDMRAGLPGQSLTAPGGLRMTLVMTPGASEGRRLEMEWLVPAGGRLVAADHYHPDGPEVWRLLEGSAGYRLDGEELTASAPHEYAVPGGVSHGHPWNAGETPLRVRQIIDTGDRELPGITAGVQGYFETLFAFSQQGRLTEQGEIVGRVQNTLTINELLLGGTYLAGPPRWAQRVLLGAVAAYGRARGLSAYARPAFDPD